MAARKYPWEVWFGLPRVVLRRGADYGLSQYMIVQTIKNNAAQRGLRVRVYDRGDSVEIVNRGVGAAVTAGESA